MDKIKGLPVGALLDVEKALNPQERKILDAADSLLFVGGRSKDRNRHKGNQKPRLKTARPYRDRAVIYTLIETGMRRQAVTHIRVEDIEFKGKAIAVVDKGERQHSYKIAQQGLEAIQDYVSQEREKDGRVWGASFLFLAGGSRTQSRQKAGQLSVVAIANIWKKVADIAGVKKTPHSARHAMGKDLVKKVGIAGVQRQLGHKVNTLGLLILVHDFFILVEFEG